MMALREASTADIAAANEAAAAARLLLADRQRAHAEAVQS